jgi:hypothetical protein
VLIKPYSVLRSGVARRSLLRPFVMIWGETRVAHLFLVPVALCAAAFDGLDHEPGERHRHDQPPPRRSHKVRQLSLIAYADREEGEARGVRSVLVVVIVTVIVIASVVIVMVMVGVIGVVPVIASLLLPLSLSSPPS